MSKEKKHKPPLPKCPVEEKLESLREAKENLPLRIRALKGDPGVCQRLREMGFCEFAQISKIRQSSALICHVCGVNVILSRYLADNIMVETVESGGSGSASPARSS